MVRRKVANSAPQMNVSLCRLALMRRKYVRPKVVEELSSKCIKASVEFGGGSDIIISACILTTHKRSRRACSEEFSQT